MSADLKEGTREPAPSCANLAARVEGNEVCGNDRRSKRAVRDLKIVRGVECTSVMMEEEDVRHDRRRGKAATVVRRRQRGDRRSNRAWYCHLAGCSTYGSLRWFLLEDLG